MDQACSACPEGKEPVHIQGQCCPNCSLIAPRTTVTGTTQVISTTGPIGSTTEVVPGTATTTPTLPGKFVCDSKFINNLQHHCDDLLWVVLKPG